MLLDYNQYRYTVRSRLLPITRNCAAEIRLSFDCKHFACFLFLRKCMQSNDKRISAPQILVIGKSLLLRPLRIALVYVYFLNQSRNQ